MVVRELQLVEVALHVLLDAGHDEAAGAVRLDAEAVAGLDATGGCDCARDSDLMMG